MYGTPAAAGGTIAAAGVGTLAYTGAPLLSWLIFGAVVLVVGGAALYRLGNRKKRDHAPR
jgi:hypothetical protein